MADIHAVATLDNQNFVRGLNQMQRATQEVEKKAKQSSEGIDEAFKKIGKAAASIYSASALLDFEKKIIGVRQEIESLEASFKSLAGETKGAQLFAGIKQFAVSTPMFMKDLASGAQTLLGFNIEAEKVMPLLQQIGDIAMGDSQRFNSLTLAFAQMSATGKLMGQDLLQMINAGFNPLTQIAQTTGKSISQLKDEMSAGKISADMVAKAFKDATSEGGKFHGMLESQSRTLKGQLSNLEGAWEDLLNELGESQEGILNEGIAMTQGLIQHWQAFGAAIAAVVASYGMFKAVLAVDAVMKWGSAMVTNIRLIGMFRKELGLLRAAQQAFNITALANPYAWLAMVLAGLTALGVAIWANSKANSAAADVAKEFADAQQKVNEKIAEQKSLIDENIDLIKDENTAIGDKELALEKLKKAMPEIFGKYKTWIDLEKDLADATARANEELQRQRIQSSQGATEKAADNVEELRRYKELVHKTSQGGKNTKFEKDELDELERLRKKWAPKVHASQGTFQNFEDAIGDLINAYAKQRNKSVGDLRQQLDEDFSRSVAKMTKKQVEQEIKAYERDLQSLSSSGKKWSSRTSEYAPLNDAMIKQRIKKLQARGQLIDDNAGKDYRAEALKDYNAKKTATKNVIKNRKSYETEAAYTEALKKAREDEKAAKERYEANGGEVKTTNKDKNKASKQSDYEVQKYKKSIADARAEVDRVNGADQAVIDAMADGTQKQLAQIEHDFATKKEAIRREYEDLLTQKVDAEMSLWKSDPKNENKSFDWFGVQSSTTLSDSEQREKTAKETAAFEQYRQALLNLSNEYETFAQKREKAEKKYDEDLKSVNTTIAMIQKSLDEAKKTGNDNAVSQYADMLKRLQDRANQITKNKADFMAEPERNAKQANIDYIKQFGEIEEKRTAIVEEYAMKREDILKNAEKTEAERIASLKTLAAQELEELKSLNADVLAKDIDWTTVFGDLKSHTKEFLTGLRDQLQQLMSDNKITDVDQIAKIQEKVRDLNQAIRAQGGLFDYIGSKQQEHLRLVQERADAEERVTRAMQEQSTLAGEDAGLRLEASAILGQNGIKAKGTSTASLIEAGKNLDPKSEAYAKFMAVIAKLTQSEQNLADARKKVTKATQDAQNATDASKKSSAQSIADWFADAQEYIAAKGIDQIPALLDSLGMGDIGAKVGKGLSAFNNASGAAADFASGNYIGAAFKAVSAVKDLGSMVGIGGGNAKEVMETTNRLIHANEQLQASIDQLKEEISDNGGMKSVSAYQKAIEYQKEYNENMQKILEVQSGYHSAHGSNTHAINEKFSRSDWARISELVNENVSNAAQLIGLTPEQINAIKKNDPKMWQKIIDTGKYDKSEYWNNYADLADKIEELTDSLNEALTGTTFESLRDEFKSTLMDMTADAQTFSDNFGEMLMNAAVGNMVSDMFSEKLETLYKSWAKDLQEAESKGISFTEADYARYKKEYDMLVQDALKQRDMIANIVGYTGDSSQSGTTRSFDAMSQDTADALMGQFMASRMAEEATAKSVAACVELSSRMLEQTNDTNTILGDIRNLTALGNGYLEDVARYTKPMSGKIDQLITLIENRL